MSTVQQIMNDAMERASIIGIGQSAASDDNTKVLTIFNDMLASFRNEGIDINLGTLDVSDTVYMDDSDILCIKINLAVQVMDNYKLPVSDYVRRQAKDLLNDLQSKYLEIREMEFPDTLIVAHSRNILTDT